MRQFLNRCLRYVKTLRHWIGIPLVACFAASFWTAFEQAESTSHPDRPDSQAKPGETIVPPDPAGVAFEEVASRVGLRHEWPEQERPIRVQQAFGCGCASFDFNNDGWQDILLIADPHPVLYLNRSDGTFEDITDPAGLKWSGEADWTGCAVGDYDGDGWLDLLLTGYHRLGLFRNVNGQHFEETTLSAGLDAKNRDHWGASAGFMDLDLDGSLDLVVLNYVQYGPDSKQFCELRPGIRLSCPPREYPPEKGDLWRNIGQGRFELIAPEQGMDSTHGIGLVLAFTDLDADGRMDLFIGNDGVDADLLHNRGGCRFENIAAESGVAYDYKCLSMAAMGADWGDYNRDGQLDLIVTNFQNMSFPLFQNQGQLCFKDVAKATGLAAATEHRLGFGANWIDFDNDGWPDLAFANGHVYESTKEIDPNSEFRQPIMLMRSEVGRRFVDLVPVLDPALAKPIVGRGSTITDFDNDGRLDLLIVDYEGQVLLLQNHSRTENHWLKLELRGSGRNRFAYGARVTARAGDAVWISEVAPASSYLSSKDPRIHWGLGQHERLETVTIRWPSGREQVLRNVAVDQILVVEEPPATPEETPESSLRGTPDL